LDGFDLRQNRSNALFVASDRHALTAPDALTIGHRNHHHLRFCAAAARDPERVIQWKNFFPGFDFQSGE
jgi:hypothetical protein